MRSKECFKRIEQHGIKNKLHTRSRFQISIEGSIDPTAMKFPAKMKNNQSYGKRKMSKSSTIQKLKAMVMSLSCRSVG